MENTMGNIFETASRMKIRFEYRGCLNVEDLWDLSVQDLDGIYKKLNAKLKLTKEDSLLGPKESEDVVLNLQIAIVKRVVEIKVAEYAERSLQAEKKVKREKILAILAEKQDGALASKSEEDLKKMLEEL